MTPYATRLRIHLAESKVRGIPFERAWADALRSVRPDTETWLPETIAFAKRAFRDAYLSIGRDNGMGVLAERDRLSVDHYYEAPERTSRRCGWGGSYCRERGAPWLCAEHAAIIDAIPKRCQAHMCRRNETGNGYCDKHADKADSNVRGGELGGQRAAA